MMLARAVVSWLPVDEDHPIINFLYTVTEPVIMPRCGRFSITSDGSSATADRYGVYRWHFILLSIVEMLLSRGI